MAGIRESLAAFPVGSLDEYQVESVLGVGAFAHVVQALDKRTNHQVALKLAAAQGASCLDDVDRDPLLMLEAQVHTSLSREPSIVPLLRCFKTFYAEHGANKLLAVLVMPVAKGNVLEYLLAQPEAEQLDSHLAMLLWVQMFNAVRVMHKHQVIHKDLKLENFLLFPNAGQAANSSVPAVRLTDFGLVQLATDSVRKIAGTPWTMSPAAFHGRDDREMGAFWSLGVILYQLVQHGAWPFKQCFWPWNKNADKMEAAIKKAVCEGKVCFTRGDLPKAIRDLILGLLETDTERRWGLQQVLTSDAVPPALLAEVAAKRPELAADMCELAQMQRTWRTASGSTAAPATAAGVSSAASPMTPPRASHVKFADADSQGSRGAGAAVDERDVHVSVANPLHKHGQGTKSWPAALQAAAKHLAHPHHGGSAGGELAEPLVPEHSTCDDDEVGPVPAFKTGSRRNTREYSDAGGALVGAGPGARCSPQALFAGPVSRRVSGGLVGTGSGDVEGDGELLSGPALASSGAQLPHLRRNSLVGAEAAVRSMWCGLRRMFSTCISKPQTRYETL